jgi:ornithine cyclodeaminase/alanine dehydrogenase-like protein (mu-crystallin family)
MRILSRADVELALPMAEAIPLVRAAFVELSAGRAAAPLRSMIPHPRDGTTLFMPGFLPASEALAVKVVAVRGRNPQRALPYIHAIVVLLDADTGRPLAAIEGASVTALRTGAASGVATELLARPETSVAAIFGSGVQARTQLAAVCAVRRIRSALVYSPNAAHVAKFIAEMQPQVTAELHAAATPAEAIRDAEVICAATTSAAPVFDGALLRPGAHVNGAGSFTPQMQEIDLATLRRCSKIVVDSRESAMAEAGDLIQAVAAGILSPAGVYAEIGEIAAGAKPGREREDEITFFKSVGHAVQDVAVAPAIYRRAVELGLGVEVSL